MTRRCAVVFALLGCAGSGADPTPAQTKPADVGAPPPASAVMRIAEWNRPLSVEDRRLKYCKMASAPFAFYRGSNHLFWHDLARDSRLARLGNARTRTWIQGDLHPHNYGAFDNDEGRVVYSLNDFDESLVADYQLDVWRMATALVLIARENHNLSPPAMRAMVDSLSTSYLEVMAQYDGNNKEDSTVFTKKHLAEPFASFVKSVAKKNNRADALAKFTAVDSGTRRFDTTGEKLSGITARKKAALTAAMAGYVTTLSGGLDPGPNYFVVKDVAQRRLAGTGSIGAKRFYILIEGPSPSVDDDLILDVKRQFKPTGYAFLDDDAKAQYDRLFPHEGKRHAVAYKALEKDVDDHLGWLQLADGDYSVRERSVYKQPLPTQELKTPSDYNAAAAGWARVIATTHARADRDFDAAFVPRSIEAEIGQATRGRADEFRALVREVAFTYADQVQADWSAFRQVLAPRNCPAPSSL